MKRPLNYKVMTEKAAEILIGYSVDVSTRRVKTPTGVDYNVVLTIPFGVEGTSSTVAKMLIDAMEGE